MTLMMFYTRCLLVPNVPVGNANFETLFQLDNGTTNNKQLEIKKRRKPGFRNGIQDRELRLVIRFWDSIRMESGHLNFGSR